MRISPFVIGMVFLVIGAVWASVIFNETQKAEGAILLEPTEAFQVQQELFGQGIGYYKMYMPNHSGEEIFVQILDLNNNVINEDRIKTKLSVGYFDFNGGGTYTARVINISDNSMMLQVEFGDTNAQEMFAPGIVIVVGALVVMITSYFKIKNHIIEQP